MPVMLFPFKCLVSRKRIIVSTCSCFCSSFPGCQLVNECKFHETYLPCVLQRLQNLQPLIALMAIFSRSSAWTLLGKCKPPFPGLIPISRPSGTLLSWKKDAVDSVSRLEDENEEKLDERIRKEYGSAGAACIVSITRSLVLISPSGHPFDASLPSAAMMPVFYSSVLME